ncbi:hypothetical protein Tco_1320463 [Tanacetum coccineum]
MMMSMSDILLGNDDEYQQSIIWRGCLCDSVGAGNICILAGQTLRLAAMADASAFSTYILSEPLKVVCNVVFMFLLMSVWIIWDSRLVSMAYYLARLPLWDASVIELYLKLLSERKLYRIVILLLEYGKGFTLSRVLTYRRGLLIQYTLVTFTVDMEVVKTSQEALQSPRQCT